MFIQGGNAFNISIIWKHSFVETIINAMANGLLKTFSGSFISFGGILSIPVYFSLSIFLTSCSASQAETFRRWLLPAMRFFFYVFYFYSFDTFMISKRLTNCFYCVFVVFNFLFFYNVGWFSSAIRALYDIYVVVTGNS